MNVLTDDEISKLLVSAFNSASLTTGVDMTRHARAIEAAVIAKLNKPSGEFLGVYVDANHGAVEIRGNYPKEAS